LRQQRSGQRGARGDAARAAVLPEPLGRACAHLCLSPHHSPGCLGETRSSYCSPCPEIISKSLNQTKPSFCQPLALPPTPSTLQLSGSFPSEAVHISSAVGELLAPPAVAADISHYRCASAAGQPSERAGPSHSSQVQPWERCQNKA